MEFIPARIRAGEWIIGAGGVLLLVSLFGLDWFSVSSTFAPTEAALGRATSFTGWSVLAHLRWLVLVLGLGAILTWYLQGSRRAPALPVCATVLTTTLGALGLLALIYRVLINEPGALLTRGAGAYVALLSTLAVVAGGYVSLREDGIRPADAPQDIETVRLAH
ncbi:MAG: hypothetical protein ACYC91_09755 [Solirubrobacteraceae bacterium]